MVKSKVKISRIESIRRALIKKQLSLQAKLKQGRRFNFIPFGKVPRDKSPIFNKTTSKEVDATGKVDFLSGETMMFSDDFFPKEKFVARRLRDL